jgi:hypothetical protein
MNNITRILFFVIATQLATTSFCATSLSLAAAGKVLARRAARSREIHHPLQRAMPPQRSLFSGRNEGSEGCCSCEIVQDATFGIINGTGNAAWYGSVGAAAGSAISYPSSQKTTKENALFLGLGIGGVGGGLVGSSIAGGPVGCLAWSLSAAAAASYIGRSSKATPALPTVIP